MFVSQDNHLTVLGSNYHKTNIVLDSKVVLVKRVEVLVMTLVCTPCLDK